MSFIWPQMLLFVLAIPLGAGLYLVRERRRRRRMATLGFVPVVGTDQAARRRGPLRRRVPAALTLAGLTILVLAMARPQSVVSLPRVEGTVILAFDVSGSMAATDMEPTRMEAAKAAAREFVGRQPSSMLVGVVAFSDSGFSIQIPTNDQALVLAAIDRLDPERGTSLGRGIQASLTTIADAEADPSRGFYSGPSAEPVEPTPDPTPVPEGTYASAAIVLLTDGENNQSPDPVDAARVAAERGVRIYTVGIGTAEGSTLEVEGFRVQSRLNEPMLRQISEVTDGTYYAAESPDELNAIYEGIDTRLVIRAEAMEITSLFAGAGVLILLVGGITSLLWLGRLP